MQFSPQQAAAVKRAEAWLKDKDAPVLFIGGYAGTGKTTIARHLAEDDNLDVLYGAYTGKAAMVMRKAGCQGASTIHSLVYKPEIDDRTGKVEFHLNEDGPISETDLLVIDECSMVDEEIGKDLLSFGKPILVLGDPEQLPPPSDKGGFFTSREPDVMLTEIHRQAEGNPIIELATRVRKGERLTGGRFGESRVVRRSDLDGETYRELWDVSDQVLCGRRVTRAQINTWARRQKGFSSDYPEKGDKLVCRRNDAKLGIFNGQTFRAISSTEIDEHAVFYVGEEEREDEHAPLEIKCHPASFQGVELKDIPWDERRGTQHFEYAYAMTTHMAQGSQWPTVLIRDESFVWRGDDRRRWLYTAITRASERVFIIN